MANKQIPALPPLDEAPADDDRFVLRDTSSGSDKSLRVDRFLERSGEQVSEHAEEQGGVHGIPEGERALHTGTNGGGTPIGGYVTVQTDLTGAEEPDPETHIKLEAGLTGAGEYNEGKLDNESVTGSAPLVEATAEIVDAESPMNGQTVHLLETERRFLRAGEAGTVEFDQMQRITGSFRANASRFTDDNNPPTVDGVFSARGGGALPNGEGAEGNADSTGAVDFDSENSPDARASSTTDGETRAKNIGVSVYMRIK